MLVGILSQQKKIGCLDPVLSAAIAVHKGAISVRN